MNRPMRLDQIKNKAEVIARQIARDRLPPDAGAIGKLLTTVEAAYDCGRRELMQMVLEAYTEFIDSDDLDGFRDTISDLIPPGTIVPVSPKERA